MPKDNTMMRLLLRHKNKTQFLSPCKILVAKGKEMNLSLEVK